jgi:dienelactone hydrolase
MDCDPAIAQRQVSFRRQPPASAAVALAGGWRRNRGGLLCILVGVAALALGGVARADLVFLKDGFTLHGKVRQDGVTHFEGASGPLWMPKNLYWVDADARAVIFSTRQVEDADKRDLTREADIVKVNRRVSRLDNWVVPPVQHIVEITPWNDKWERVYRLRRPSDDLILNIGQRLSVLTPHYARVEGLRYNWSQFYLTSELGPATVRTLLAQHPDFQETAGVDPAKRFRLYRFFVQAGWYDLAEQELEALKGFPDQKDKIDEGRAHLRKLRLQQRYDDLAQAHQAGRHQWVQERLAEFPQEGVEEKLLDRVRALQAGYEAGNLNLALARRYLQELPAQIGDPSQRQLFSEMAAAIRTDLSHDTVGRLDAFLGLAQQAERERRQDKQPELGPDQLLALAVSGWLLGNSSAEAKVDTARRLWRTRAFVLAYQRMANPADRRGALYEYQRGETVAFDELAQLIGFLPPPEPFNPWLSAMSQLLAQSPVCPLASAPWALASGAGPLAPGPFELQVQLPGDRFKGPTYYVQLPPEYHLGRSYPVLLVLHQGGERPLEMLRRWSDLAARHGYLLVAPEWELGLRQTYTYSAEEHAAVVDVLRDLRQRFPVDSDRVFLTGFGEGGTMAFDVGLAHPDLFAGVLPFGGRPQLFAERYWRNGQYLPFYVVDGDRNGANPRDSRRLFDQWLPRGYPSLFVLYKGRGLEWYEAELPYAFDWMSRKKRAPADTELGKHGGGGPLGEEFQTMRATDNRFYWLSTDEIYPRHLNDGRRWDQRVTGATLQASVGRNNQINVNVRGLKQVTVWLGRGLIDLDKPVTIILNLQRHVRNAKPNLETLLEDLYQRGDRQRLFLARVDFNL